MRDKGLVFEELAKARHTLEPRRGERRMELALRIAVLVLAGALLAARGIITP